MPDPIEAIKLRMEQLGMKEKDLAEVFGFSGRVSEILNKKRKLTLDMIRKLSTNLSIPIEVLIQEPLLDYCINSLLKLEDTMLKKEVELLKNIGNTALKSE